jgi:hypothetical protein
MKRKEHHSLLYKRGDNDENEEDKRIRELVEISNVNENLMFILRELDIEHLYRYHAWRLIRLMNSSTSLRNTIQLKAKTTPDFWYHICKYSFPDIILYIYSINKDYNTLKSIYDKYGDSYRNIINLDALFMQTLTIDEYDLSLNELKDIISIPVINRPRNASIFLTRGFAFNQLDRTFTDRVLLDKCLQHASIARKSESFFKMIFPCGIPPIEYCFQSQMKLREIMIDFIEIVIQVQEGIDFKDFIKYMVSKTTLDIKPKINDIKWMESIRKQRSVMDYTQFERCIKKGSFINFDITKGKGPLQEVNNSNLRNIYGRLFQSIRPQDGDVFDFSFLEDYIIDFLMEHGERIEFANMKKQLYILLNTIRESMILFADDLEGSLIIDERIYERRFGDTLETDKLYDPSTGSLQFRYNGVYVYDGDKEALFNKRKDTYEKYGTYDPLFIDLFTNNEESVADLFTNDQWRNIIMNQIDWIKTFVVNKNDEEYKRIESSLYELQCMSPVCSKLENLSVDPVYPYNTYCNDTCRKNHLL